ncbi:MAG: aspartate aminotransferase [Acidobacteria bacterium]|nr:MAG: aspartate aminotransferase [Acidobacteriota bacterium]PYY09682.1 MAG: aspartate aminotransferase [Acidobacteriota bacterium]
MSVSRLHHVAGITVDRIGQAADAARDPSILRLENMDTDVAPPPAAMHATHQAIEDASCNSYLPFLGQDALRRAAASHVSKLSGVQYDWSTQCIISAGGLNGILNTLLALLEPGDEVVLGDPIYAGLLNRVRLATGVPKLIPFVAEMSGWKLDLYALKRAASPRTRAVLMVNPSFPTGAYLIREDWEQIAEFCEATNAWLLYDAALERILFDGRPYLHPASLPAMAERTITVGCVTKEYRMIGWRVGWIVGPSSLMNDVARVSMANVVCQVGIAMPGATAALTTQENGLAEAVEEWQKRRDVLLEELSGLPVIPPHGGWCLLVNVKQLGMDCEAAARLLFEKGKIAATPMRSWGDSGDQYVRFVYANEPMQRLRGVRERIQAAWSK